jgi:antitoxin component YwqK of YwqJK toxin-antitoxin module
MKHLLTIFCLVLLVSCSKEVPSDKLVFRNGLIYEINSTAAFTGSSVDYHDNGQLSSKENYKDGKLDGLVEEFYISGQIWNRKNYKDGKLDGLVEEFYLSDRGGQLWKRKNYKDGKEHGLVEYFSPYGVLYVIEEYKDGKRIK